jgi:hypothetical protein
MELSIFNEDGSLKSAEEITQIQFLQTLQKNPHLVDAIANNASANKPIALDDYLGRIKGSEEVYASSVVA